MVLKYTAKIVIVFACVILELFAHNYWLDLSWDLRMLLYYSCGLAIVIIPMLRYYPAKLYKWAGIPLIRLSFFLAILWYAYSYFSVLFVSHPIDISKADMLPVIQVMVDRLVNQQHVYDLIPEIWEGIQPIYLPAMWLPYTLPYLIGEDLRYTNLLLLFIGLFLITILIPKRYNQTWWTLTPLIASFMLIFTFVSKDSNYLLHSEEPVVAAYYLFLSYALYRKNTLLIAIALTCCLLSRYSLIAWVLMYLAWVYLESSKKKAIVMLGLTLISSLFLLFITGAYTHLEDFIRLPGIYEQAVLDTDLQWKYKPLISYSLGFARWFGYDSIHLISLLFKIFVLLIPTLSLILYFRFKSILNRNMFVFCSLKLCLIFFYGFLIIPYKYLFFTNTILSIAILSIMLRFDFTHMRTKLHSTKTDYVSE